MDYRLVHKMNLSRGNAIAGVCDAGRVMSRSETTSNNSPYNPQMGARSPLALAGAVRQNKVATTLSLIFLLFSELVKLLSCFPHLNAR